MQAKQPQTFSHPFSRAYWKAAAGEFSSTRVLAFAAVIVALRAVMKLFPIPVGENVNVYMGYLFNALGSMVYGPLMALVVGAVTDTLGVIIAPSGPYFLPFVFVEMLGSFLFALFLYRAKLTNLRVVLSKFSVNLLANVVLNSLLMVPYMQLFYGKNYNVFNVVRIVKNVVLFPAEGFLILLFLSALIPALRSLGLVSRDQEKLSLTPKTLWMLLALFLIASACSLVWTELSRITDFLPWL